ncbi:MAG: alpha/beta hydrolase [Nitriliruptorales bacterium]|nr:alpha/beta hydrolase [Nitriliruptorales bacterium]
MIAGWILLAGSLVGLWFTKQSLRPVRLPKVRAIGSFFAGWLMDELVFHHLVWQTVAVAVLIWFGALEHWAGWVGLGLAVLQWLVLDVVIIRFIRQAPEVLEESLTDALGADYRRELPDGELAWDGVAGHQMLMPFRQGWKGVHLERDRVYSRVAAQDLKLDVFRPDDWDGPPRPALIYVHGGAWVIGYREHQGLPLLNEMAARGWVGIRPQYRLSPFHTFPAHVIDIKRSIAWVREHADELNVDPSFIAIAGGSAGGHLTAVAALTPNRPDLQPGFEDADTSVQAAIPIYGVYDFRRLVEYQGDEVLEWLERWLMHASMDEDPDLWDTASPVTLVHPDAPPFFVLHGAGDTLTPPDMAGRFASLLRDVSHQPVARAELPGAQHAFDIFPSWRSAVTVRAIARFLTVVRARQAAAASDEPVDARAAG